MLQQFKGFLELSKIKGFPRSNIVSKICGEIAKLPMEDEELNIYNEINQIVNNNSSENQGEPMYLDEPE